MFPMTHSPFVVNTTTNSRGTGVHRGGARPQAALRGWFGFTPTVVWQKVIHLRAGAPEGACVVPEGRAHAPSWATISRSRKQTRSATSSIGSLVRWMPTGRRRATSRPSAARVCGERACLEGSLAPSIVRSMREPLTRFSARASVFWLRRAVIVGGGSWHAHTVRASRSAAGTARGGGV